MHVKNGIKAIGNIEAISHRYRSSAPRVNLCHLDISCTKSCQVAGFLDISATYVQNSAKQRGTHAFVLIFNVHY